MTDAVIVELFDRRERLKRALDAAEAEIRAVRADYARSHGLLSYPSIDAMQRAVMQLRAG